MSPLTGADIIRIGSKTYTRSRALAAGFVVDTGKGGLILTASGKALEDTVAAKAKVRKDREADWRRRQGLPAIIEPETTTDGVLKSTRKPKPLKPQNVTSAGEPVTDETILAELQAKADAIEARKSAERDV